MHKKNDIEEIEASQYQTLEILIDQNDQEIESKHEKSRPHYCQQKTQIYSVEQSNLTHSQIEELERQNKILKERLLISEQANQKLQKELQQKRENITYLTIKSFDLVKLYLESQKNVEEKADEGGLEKSRENTMTVETQVESQSIEELKKKVEKYRSKFHKIRDQKKILITNLQVQRLKVENLQSQVKDFKEKEKRKDKK